MERLTLLVRFWLLFNNKAREDGEKNVRKTDLC
jgi:hypothetical protein